MNILMGQEPQSRVSVLQNNLNYVFEGTPNGQMISNQDYQQRGNQAEPVVGKRMPQSSLTSLVSFFGENK